MRRVWGQPEHLLFESVVDGALPIPLLPIACKSLHYIYPPMWSALCTVHGVHKLVCIDVTLSFSSMLPLTHVTHFSQPFPRSSWKVSLKMFIWWAEKSLQEMLWIWIHYGYADTKPQGMWAQEQHMDKKHSNWVHTRGFFMIVLWIWELFGTLDSLL